MLLFIDLLYFHHVPFLVLSFVGEDGFEISVPSSKAVALTTAFLDTAKKAEGIMPTGLGARDSLRLEAGTSFPSLSPPYFFKITLSHFMLFNLQLGLCLYGHDLNEDISPIEGALAWLIGKRRREQGGFIGSGILMFFFILFFPPFF